MLRIVQPYDLKQIGMVIIQTAFSDLHQPANKKLDPASQTSKNELLGSEALPLQWYLSQLLAPTFRAGKSGLGLLPEIYFPN
jgi:hypothetical protein